MPGLDRTGPTGQGPMTGGRRGRCRGRRVEEAVPEVRTEQQPDTNEPDATPRPRQDMPGTADGADAGLGVGRGGAPRGGGLGRCFGGGRNRKGTGGQRGRRGWGGGRRSP